MDRVDEGWRFVSIGAEGHATDVGGTNPWDVDWVRRIRRITVAHPDYPDESHQLDVYELAAGDPPVIFAAGELSNGVWAFFIPAENPALRSSGAG